jgi:hypothetical protein
VAALKPPLDALQPENGRAAVSVDIRDDVCPRGVTRSFARHHKTFRGFVHHADARHGTRHGARLIGARIVDDQNVVGRPRLGQKRIQTGRKQSRPVVRADDHANR